MKVSPPEHLQFAVKRVQRMTWVKIAEWLEKQLKGQGEMLPGDRDDQPLQALLNILNYLDIAALRRVEDAVIFLLTEWRDDKRQFKQAEFSCLLEIIDALKSVRGKNLIKAIIQGANTSQRPPYALAEMLITINKLSRLEDVDFWKTIYSEMEMYSGLAFQTLAKIYPREAINALETIPRSKSAQMSITQAVLDLLADSDFDEKRRITSLVQKSEGHAQLIVSTLKKAGYIRQNPRVEQFRNNVTKKLYQKSIQRSIIMKT